MKKINGKKYKWNDYLQQYELVELGRPKKELKMEEIEKSNKHNKVHVQAKPVDGCSACLFFDSITEASKRFGVAVSTIFAYMKNGKDYDGYTFERVEEIPLMMKNDLENMMNIISALKSGQKVYRKKKSGGDWELVKCGACDFINYDYKIGCKMSDIVVSIRIDECLKDKLDKLAKSKGISINSLLKDKLKKIIIEEFNMN